VPIQLDPTFLPDLAKYGAADISACFHCGNCTAVCNLSEEGASFPRKMIRLAQLGAKSELVGAAEPWLCYACGECATTCPRQAEPAEFMASLRRWQIAQLDPTGMGKLWFKVPAFAMLATLALMGVFGTLMVSIKGSKVFPQWVFSGTAAYETIHHVGMVVGGLLVALLATSFVMLVKRSGILPLLKGRKPLAALKWLAMEMATMKRHGDCEADSGTRKPAAKPAHKDHRLVHLAMMWGFIGLGVATTLDFLFIFFLGFEVFWPARAIGTVAGVVMLWGVSAAIWRRFNEPKAGTRHTNFADAWVLAFLWILAVTGFWLEVVVTLKARHVVHDWVLILHAAMAMEFVLLFRMTKMAHVLVRPFMLLKYRLERTAPESAK
jgi:ferredoxin